MSQSNRLAFHRTLARLPEARRRALALAATLRARELGLVVLRAEAMDIPLTLTPEAVDASVLAERGRDAKAVLSAVAAGARWVLSQGLETPLARLLFAHFGPLETACLANWRDADDVTIARVDWFVDGAGRHHALELNATIPAMEAYSDAAARAWIESVGAAAALPSERIAALVAKNGSNAEELRASIVAHSPHRTGTPSMVILHRENDSQVRELQALARHFTSKGHRVRLATPGDVQLAEGGRVLVGGESFDILYRHIFARRMPEGSDLAKVALGGTTPRLQNPVNGQLEVKGLFAEVSRLIGEGQERALGLDEVTLGRARRVMPWTRLFGEGPCVGPDGTREKDLIALVRADGGRFVLKRSWDYGGKSVYIGRDVLASEGLSGWHAKVDEALSEGPGAFVVQQVIDAPRHPHCVVGTDGETTFEEVFVDASTYSASGEAAVPGGSVARYARSGIVNIVGGGGVCPLVRSDVAEEICGAFAAVQP